MSPPTPQETPKARKDRLDALAYNIWDNRRKLKRKRDSFNATDWSLAYEMTNDELARNKIQLEDALEELQQSRSRGYYQDDDMVRLHSEKRELLRWQLRRCLRQMQRLTTTTTTGGGDEDKSTPSGLALVNKGVGPEEEEESVRKAFRERVIKEYACNHPEPEGPYGELLWCPVLSDWVGHTCTVAVQLFDNRHGQEGMDDVFGRDGAGDEGEPELFHPRNGLLVCSEVWAAIEEGVFAIVPDVPGNATAEEICRWREMQPREYKVQILDPDRREAKLAVGYAGKVWNDLNGKRLEFRSEARPSARYLFFLYLTQILRCALRRRFQKGGRIPQGDGVGKKIWAVPGPYVKRSTIRAFVEEFGQEYEHFFPEPESGEEDEELKEAEHADDDRFYIAAVEQVQHRLREQTFDDEDEDEDYDPEEAEAAAQAMQERMLDEFIQRQAEGRL
ncbi:hypothetical protein FQN50_009847 [Emmonsiellopsis sp. PD_5]|nr:hypothetical protein FQN50_009847 [Emmonsiellopsis sp. PD_5]